MALYIQRAVIDANVINTKGNVLGMRDLESFFALGIVEILKSSVLDVEFEKWKRGKEKAKSYGTIFGGNWIGHTRPSCWGGRHRDSNRFTTLSGESSGKSVASSRTDLTLNRSEMRSIWMPVG